MTEPPVAIESPLVTVIAVGNPYRRDDAVGAAVLAAVSESLGPDPRVRLVELDGEPVRVVQAWEGSALVWLVDATASDRPPGSLQEVDARQLGEGDSSWSGIGGGHALGLREAIEFAAALDRFPAELRVLGIEGETFDHGEGLSSAVSSAVPAAAARLLASIRPSLESTA
ncbi:MAG: hydrogenase maturation protease [Ilumatobacteraceae bacterium]